MKTERLKRLNPSFQFYIIEDEAFNRFGRKLNVPSDHLMRYVYQSIPLMGCSFHYEPDYPELHHFALYSKIRKEIFQDKDIQFGILSGFNEHTEPMIKVGSSKCLIAFTECILVVSSKENESYGFLLKKGDCVELYPGTFHSLPIHAHLKGFAVGILYEKRQGIRCVNR